MHCNATIYDCQLRWLRNEPRVVVFKLATLFFLWFIIRHAPLHSAILHAVLISYYIDFTLLYILLGFPWALSLLSSLLCIVKVYCVDKGTELLLVLRCEVLFSHWPGSYLLLTGDADKSLAQPISRCILLDCENISFDASLVLYINSTNVPPIMTINRIYEHQNLLSL